MPSIARTWTTLTLMLAFSAGCADPEGHANGTPTDDEIEVPPDGGGGVALDQDDAGLQGLSREVAALSKGPVYGKASPNDVALGNKLASIPSDLRAAYFGYPISDVSSTPEAVIYRFYYGTVGMGAIYLVNGNRYLYGAILDTWARQGYESGALGWPSLDPVRLGDHVEQQFHVDSYNLGVDSQCLADVRTFVVQPYAGAAASTVWRNEYYDSNNPGQLSSSPQTLTMYQASPLSPAARELSGGALLWQYWCGPVPAWLGAVIGY